MNARQKCKQLKKENKRLKHMTSVIFPVTEPRRELKLRGEMSFDQHLLGRVSKDVIVDHVAKEIARNDDFKNAISFSHSYNYAKDSIVVRGDITIVLNPRRTPLFHGR